MSMSPSAHPIYSRHELKLRIARGEVLVLYDRNVYKLNSWFNKHPGGQLAILHFVGRDATDEIDAYHPDHVIKQMKPFVVGRISDEDWDDGPNGIGFRPLNPPIQIGLWPIVEADDQDRCPCPSPDIDSGYSSLETSSSEGDEQQSKPDSSRAPALQNSNHQSIGDREASYQLDRSIIRRLEALEPSIEAHQQEATDEGYDLSPLRQKQISRSYRHLHQQIRQAGLYRAPWPFYGYGPDLVRYTILFLIFFYTSPFYPILRKLVEPSYLILQPTTLQLFISAVFLGLWWHQITFVAHDAGHSGVTGDWKTDRLIGILIGDFLGGISIGWWCDNHDVHHLVTNHPEHDPDIQHLPFFAISHKFFKSLRSTYYQRVMKFDRFSKLMIKFQRRSYYFIMLFARFNLFANSYVYLFNRKQQKFRNLEVAGIIFFWCYFGTLLYLLPSYPIRLMYTLVSFAVTSPLHVQIVLSHFAQSTADLGLQESFAHRQLRTTMDVDCEKSIEFLHGGLNLQITHHLFPRIPRHNLRFVSQTFVQPWCNELNLKYNQFKFLDGNLRVLNQLQNISNQLKILKLVASAQTRGEIH